MNKAHTHNISAQWSSNSEYKKGKIHVNSNCLQKNEEAANKKDQIKWKILRISEAHVKSFPSLTLLLSLSLYMKTLYC